LDDRVLPAVIIVLVTLTQGVPAAVIMLVIVVVYQQIEIYLLQTTILYKAADVSGFLVISSILVFGTLRGAIGPSSPSRSSRRSGSSRRS